MTSAEFRQRLQRIEGLVRAIESAGDPNARASAVDLMQSVMEIHAAGIERMMEITFESGEAGGQLIDRFGDDELVSGLLLLYGLHPLDVETRVIRALDSVRPYLQSHGGNVELLGVADGVVRLRFQGSCNGCSSSAATLEQAIEEAIYEAAPDVAGIEVEGATPQPSALVQLARGPSR
jgi:Fe-S cluster biogenesis protein NfuA